MNRLEDFATDRHPLHASRLPQFMSCPFKIIMEHLGLYHRDGGVGAQTGTVVHKGVQTWHTNNRNEDSAIGVMESLRGDFPLADYTEAERLFRCYVKDPQNQKATLAVHAGKILIETLLHGEIAPGIVLEGTADAIRDEGGQWKIIDLKTSKISGDVIRSQHLFQVAAYAYLATKRFKRPVLPGAIIMIRGYEKKGGKVWFPYDLTMDEVNGLMAMVADRVRDVRAGRLQLVPGEYCQFCIGVHKCVPMLTKEKQNAEDK